MGPLAPKYATLLWKKLVWLHRVIKHTYTHTDTQTHTHTDTHTLRHSDTKTHRHTNTHTHTIRSAAVSKLKLD